MAKRFTDTDKWKKPFIRGLQGPYKLLWLYILDDCDHAGIWQVDFDVALIRIGVKELNQEKAMQFFAGKITPFSKGEKWFIPDFIEFQYGTLTPENRAHKSVISLLKKYGLFKENKGLISSFQGAKDKDKEKDKEMDMDMDKERAGLPENKIHYPFIEDRAFYDVFKKWTKYKLDRRERYKSTESLESAYRKLLKLSDGNVSVAAEIIDESIANNYAGFFALKTNNSSGFSKPTEKSKLTTLMDSANRVTLKID